MTAQNNDFQNDECRDQADQAATETDPLGPIAMPKRSRIGARAMALVGTVSMAAVAMTAGGGDPHWPITSIES